MRKNIIIDLAIALAVIVCFTTVPILSTAILCISYLIYAYCKKK